MRKGPILAASLALLCGAACPASEPDALPLPGLDLARFINASRFTASGTAPMDFDRSPGELSVVSARLGTFVAEPARLGDRLSYLGYLDYGVTDLDFDRPAAALTPGDDLLHRLSFSSLFVYNEPGSRWHHGLYLEPSLRSDFEDLGSDDLFVSFALASAHQCSEELLVGIGVHGSDLLHDPSFLAGPGFAWTPNEDWLVSYYGPRFIARRSLGDDNQLAFEAATQGGYWNVETLGASTRLDFRSWRAGLLYRHRLAGELWLELGAGYTLGNKLSLSTPGGLGLFEAALGKLDPAPYGFLGLTLRRW